jgi:excisionase family DNA binding protein
MRRIGRDSQALLTPDEVCEYLNVDQPRLRKLRLESGLPFVRESPEEILYPRNVLDSWLEENGNALALDGS